MAVLIFYIISNQFKLLMADYYFMQLREARVNNQYFSAIKMYEFIKEDVPTYSFYDQQFAVIMADWITKYDDQRFKKFGQDKLKQILPQVKSQSYDDIYVRGRIYEALADKNNNNYFDLAENEFKKLIAISPEMPSNYFELAQLFLQEKKYSDAVKTFNIELTKLPDLNNANLNSDHKQIFENEMYRINIGIGDSYLGEMNYSSAEKSYLSVLKIDEKFYAAYGKLADLYIAKGDLNKAIWYNEIGMKKEPNNYEWPYNLANIYMKKGDKQKSAEYYSQAKKLNPNMEL
jgi:tetratricopeptide (TPR) repeat protein